MRGIVKNATRTEIAQLVRVAVRRGYTLQSMRIYASIPTIRGLKKLHAEVFDTSLVLTIGRQCLCTGSNVFCYQKMSRLSVYLCENQIMILSTLLELLNFYFCRDFCITRYHLTVRKKILCPRNKTLI